MSMKLNNTKKHWAPVGIHRVERQYGRISKMSEGRFVHDVQISVYTASARQRRYSAPNSIEPKPLKHDEELNRRTNRPTDDRNFPEQVLQSAHKEAHQKVKNRAPNQIQQHHHLPSPTLLQLPLILRALHQGPRRNIHRQ